MLLTLAARNFQFVWHSASALTFQLIREAFVSSQTTNWPQNLGFWQQLSSCCCCCLFLLRVSVCVNAVFIWLTHTFECGFSDFNVGHRQQQLANSLTVGQITWLFWKNNCRPSQRMWAKQRRVCRLAKLKMTVHWQIIKTGKKESNSGSSQS